MGSLSHQVAELEARCARWKSSDRQWRKAFQEKASETIELRERLDAAQNGLAYAQARVNQLTLTHMRPISDPRLISAEDLVEGQHLHVVFKNHDEKAVVATGELLKLDDRGNMWMPEFGCVINAADCLAILLVDRDTPEVDLTSPVREITMSQLKEGQTIATERDGVWTIGDVEYRAINSSGTMSHMIASDPAPVNTSDRIVLLADVDAPRSSTQGRVLNSKPSKSGDRSWLSKLRS